MRSHLKWSITAASVVALLTSGCKQPAIVAGAERVASDQMADGTIASAERGRATIETYGCGKCHTIPGIRGAHGVVGPPLNFFAQRTYIAGNFPNTPDTLSHWVMAPQTMKPKTAMPSLGLSESQSRDVVAYLYELH